MRRLAAVLGVVLATALGPGFFLTSPASAAALPTLVGAPCVGSSLCSPANAPLLAEFVTAAPSLLPAVASGAVQTGSLATAATSVAATTGVGLSAEAIGGTVGLVLAGGGALAWKLHVDSTSGLPSGTTTVPLSSPNGVMAAPLTWDQSTGTVGAAARGNVPNGPRCWQGKADGLAYETHAYGSASAWGMAFTWAKSNGGVSGPFTYVKCFMSTGSFSLPGFASVAALAAYVPTSPVTVLLVGGTVGSTGPASRSVQQTVTCKTPAGTTHTITNSTASAAWTPGQIVDVAGLMCPDGEQALANDVKVVTSGGADAPVGTVNQPTTITNLPIACFAAAAACRLDLQRATSVGTGTWLSCFSDPAPCTGLFTLPLDVQTERFRCVYGNGGTVAWAARPWNECSIYGHIFAPEPTPGLVPPVTDTGAEVCSMSWGDVLTGAVVYKAIVCALKWAFVPRESMLREVGTSLSTSWSTSAPGVVAGAASNIGAPLRDLSTVDDAAASCLGPEVDWPWGFLPHAHPFATCEGLPATLAGYFRPILGAVVLLLSFGTALRTLGRTIGLDTPRAVAS